MPINISDERIAQVTEVIHRWINAFTPFTESNTPDTITSCFDPSAEWYDHGFHVVRVGHKAILGLHKAFLHCNQPFRAEVKASHGKSHEKRLPLIISKRLDVTSEGAAVEQLWIGTCKNDIVRPDGRLVMEGSGKEFKTHVGFFLKINDEGKITRIDEYDHRYWDEGKQESEYERVDLSIKSGL